MKKVLRLGLDVGSTTVKVVVLDEQSREIFKEYRRHLSDVRNAVSKIVHDARSVLAGNEIAFAVTGSGGLSLAEAVDADFVQEVIASTEAVEHLIPHTDVAIELGGEDAKITYFGKSLEQRMNGTCAGGTGAFIDQMAALLQTDADGLNEYAKNYKTIYPIASRCGVFAKTDVQPLLNEGASKEDIAVSVLQAVVNQTISGLAQGKPIRGRVAFLGGPLHFITELKRRFIESLELGPEDVVKTENEQYYVAYGCALSANADHHRSYERLLQDLDDVESEVSGGSVFLKPLIATEEEHRAFQERHARAAVPEADMAAYEGNAFLGIDAGSTTTKVALITEDGKLLFTHYGSNKGKPLESVVEALLDMNEKMHDGIRVVNTAVTGYGEHLLKAALRIDIGEIETVAHYKAAQFFMPEVDFILDIGGQDMKSLKIRNGTIESIMLNEACSSGCGSFIQTFAEGLGMDVKSFAKIGLTAKAPVDLGTRCTVFMNSKVKQAQKDGAEVADISAGLALSVIKNALFKVIRIRNMEELGEHIVVQGGTFYNDAVLRALEQVTEHEVVRPTIAGIMGAFGCALIARERYEEGYETSLIPLSAMQAFEVSTSMKRCGKCGNNCLMTVNHFSDGRDFISGNRCEKGLGLKKAENDLPNLFDYKYNKLFRRRSLPAAKAPRGVIGIPRVLNMYEDYPLWHTFLTELGYRVVLSSRSSKEIYEKGMETIHSESMCYPAKIVNGHIADLIERGIEKIFYPGIPYTVKEYEGADDHYNCPIVTSYPEAIAKNVDAVTNEEVTFYYPFLPIDHVKRLKRRLMEEMGEAEGWTYAEVSKAVDKAYEVWDAFKQDIRDEGERALAYMKEHGKNGIVLAGRPYHVDPEINHGIPELINLYDFVVLSEESVAHLSENPDRLRVVNQWTYHSRLYRAADFVSERDDLDIIQLNSFGCGLDAVTTDQVQEIMEAFGKIYTVIKIDEISNLGAVRIRLRSLIAALDERRKNRITAKRTKPEHTVVEYTEEMQKAGYTILCPQMSPIHFRFVEQAFRSFGYNLHLLEYADHRTVEEGLKYVNNDACYPAIITIGQMMQALNSGKFDLNKTALIMSQTGGGCRATNYIAFIRKALKDAGMEQVPVISLNAAGIEKHAGFKLTVPMINRAIMALVYGDLLMRVLYRVRPYEQVPGSANELYEHWSAVCDETIRTTGSWRAFRKNIRGIVRAFDELPIHENMVKPRVGIVGEILVKYHPVANNHVVDLLEKEGAEVVCPDLIDFFMYCSYDTKVKREQLSGSSTAKWIGQIAMKGMDMYRRTLMQALRDSKRFDAPCNIDHIASLAERHISLCHQTGEGWFLLGEMVELLESGVDNIACLQPFACLPNHIVGKGMIKELRRSYPYANIAPIDYDASASEVNQINRIKLMLSIAFKNLKRQRKIAETETDVAVKNPVAVKWS
ncbi:MAG: acyl-CoA dehydratase activase-related protein [Eubacteriales bacterium]|nr:acyl-CoA dehydratase activase-related protein [Eubacteriales bacterium]